MKGKGNYRDLVLEIICFLFIVLFLYAAVSKLLDFDNFRIQLGQSPMLTRFASLVAYIIPTIEILLALSLSMNKFRTIALYASLGLITAFSAYIAVILNFSNFIPCSCGGILERLGWTEHLVFNIVFVLLAIIAIVLNDKVQMEKLELRMNPNPKNF